MLIPLSLVAFPIVFWAIRRSARRQGPVRKGLALEFGIARGPKLLIAFVLIVLVAFTILVFATSFSRGASPVGIIIPLVVIVGIVLAIPHAVVLDDTGIRQRRLLFSKRCTPWADVSTVTGDANRGRTIVWSSDGEIAAVFSWFLAGRHQFEEEIRAHVKHAVFERD